MATKELISPISARYVASALALLDPTPHRVIEMQPGEQVAYDECCDGQLWCRVVGVSPLLAGTPKASGYLCGILGWEVTLALGLIRCLEVQDDNGVAPAAASISASGYEMLDDLAVLQQVVICSPDTYRPGAWIPLGPQGGCYGGEQQFTVRVQPNCCPTGDDDGR